MKKIIASDFDGTLTTRDSMMEIIIYQRGKWGLYMALLRILPWLIMMFLHLYSNQRTKEKLLYNCFGKMKREEFDAFCQRFADTHKSIIRDSLYKELKSMEDEEDTEVIVVTASPEIWVRKFLPGMTVLGTRMEFDDKGFTGHFLTPNCYGKEKVNRLLQHIPDITDHRERYHITAYGDSRGDRELLAFADTPHLIKKSPST